MRIGHWMSDASSSALAINHNGWPILLVHVDRDSRFIINRPFPECRIKTKKASFCFVLQRSRSIINSIGPETILGESRHVHHLTEPCFCESHFTVFLVILNEFRSEEHTSEFQSLMRISYAVFCLKKKKSK